MMNDSNGILLMDKPVGISSAKLVARVKRLLAVKKAGHAGTLDPFATGLMICCINKATKVSGKFLHGDKTYTATLCLGIETDTQDLTGTVISRCECPEIPEERIVSAFGAFEGESEQIPPAYSALKHQGVPLYKLARAGKPISKPPRTIFISRLEIEEISLPEIRFAVRCTGGTYIRTLASDIGKRLGCGAHLTALRRIECGGYHIAQAMTLEKLEEAVSSGNISERLIPVSLDT